MFYRVPYYIIFLDSGAICKRTFYEKQQCIDHIKKDHPNGGGKICKVLVRKKNNNKPEINKPIQVEKKQEVQSFRCCFCTGKYETIEKFKVRVFWKLYFDIFEKWK